MRQPSGDQNGLRNCPREEQVLKRENRDPQRPRCCPCYSVPCMLHNVAFSACSVTGSGIIFVQEFEGLTSYLVLDT